MRPLRRLLPSLNTLYVFESAARLGSFSRAAAELGISQPAVSHRIRELENGFGLSLFARRHRGIELTADGERFFVDVSAALGRILDSARGLEQSAKAAGSVTLSVSTALAAHWLLPRTSRLRASHPEITLRVQTTDSEVDTADGDFDIAIPLGTGPWRGMEQWRFCRESIFPVCAPSFLDRFPDPLSPPALAGATLLQLDEPYDGKRMSWQTWLAQAGIDAGPSNAALRFNDYLILLQAAVAGEGIALGWRHIVNDLLHQGLLVRAHDTDIVTDNDFVLLRPDRAKANPAVETVRKWLIDEATDSFEGSHWHKLN